MSFSDPSKALLMQHFFKDLTILLSGMAFHAADTHRATSEGDARKGRLKESCGLEPRTNFFFRLRNRQKLVRVRFGCGLDSRIYGTFFVIFCLTTLNHLVCVEVSKILQRNMIWIAIICKET